MLSSATSGSQGLDRPGCTRGDKDMPAPTKQTVLRAINAYNANDPLFARYRGKPKTHYVGHGERLYPLKKIWAAAHTPPLLNAGDFHTHEARSRMRELGFQTVDVNDDDLDAQFAEGERTTREVTVFMRHPGLAKAAKEKYNNTCQACGLEPSFYGNLGARFVECHHINELAKQGGGAVLNDIEAVTVLCANCHRMIHTKSPCLTIKELRQHIRKSKDSN